MTTPIIRLLAFLAVTLSLAASPAAGQVPATLDEARVAFLREQIVGAGPVTGGLVFSFPDEFYDARLILVGESHGVAAPQGLDLELLRHLNAVVGLTDYLAEVDPIQADTLNRYLDNGDEALLERVFDYWTSIGAQWGNTAFEAKLRAIRTLNLGLPLERRVRIFGIDAVQDWPLLAEWIQDRGGLLTPEALAAAPDRPARARLALAALDDIDAGAKAAELGGVLGDIAEGRERETVIFNAYARAVTGGALGQRPAYGLWGLFHVLQGSISGSLPFAARVVNSDLPTADRVVSIVLHALESSALVSYPGVDGPTHLQIDTLNIDGPLVRVPGAAELKAASEPNRITLFHAAAPGSPFTGGGDFVEIRTSLGQNLVPDSPDAPFSAYAQYVGVFRGSDWAPPR